MESLMVALVVYCLLGIGAGFLSGLLGAGGGLVMVPGLMLIFHWETMDPNIAMHIAVGTSLAAMIPVAFRSLTSHMKHNVPFFPIYKQMAPALVVGVIGGGILAKYIHSNVLQIVFGIFVLVMACTLFYERKSAKDEVNLPGMTGMSLAGGFVGVQSGMLGVAGSSFSVPFLTHRGVNIHTAVVVSVAIAMTVSICGTITFILAGLHAAGLPHWSTGFVYWPAWLGLAMGGVFIAPLGARISHLVPARKLKVYFGLFLLVVAGKMLI